MGFYGDFYLFVCQYLSDENESFFMASRALSFQIENQLTSDDIRLVLWVNPALRRIISYLTNVLTYYLKPAVFPWPENIHNFS